MDICLNSFLNPSGLSYVGQSYFKCFVQNRIRVIPVWLGPPEALESLDKNIVEEMLLASQLPTENAPLQFHAGRADDMKLLKHRSAVVGSIVLEGNRLLPQHLHICKQLDLVFVPSYFCRNVCVSSGVPKNRVCYLPYPLDSNRWNTTVQPKKPSDGIFRFLYLNTCYERKGWDVLLRAFWEEFSADEPVELVIKSYREEDRTEPLDILVALEAAKLGVDREKRAKITIVDEVLSAEALPSFMKSCDAFVSPHRSEGFGLNIWHAMAIGLPVICTNYGGNTDFAKPETSWLVGVSEMKAPSEAEIKVFPHYRGIIWAEPDRMDLRRQMRSCMLNPVEAKRRAEVASGLVHMNYSHNRTFDLFATAMKTHLPKIFEQICVSKHIEELIKQPTERFSSTSVPLTLLEI